MVRPSRIPERNGIVGVARDTPQIYPADLPYAQRIQNILIDFTHEVPERKLPSTLQGPYMHWIESVEIGDFYFREGFGGRIGIHATTSDTINIITIDNGLTYQQTVNLILNRVNDILNENNERPLIQNALFKFNSNTSIRIRAVGLGDVVDPTNEEIDASERTVAMLKEVGIYDITVGANIFGFKKIPPPILFLYGPPAEDQRVNMVSDAPNVTGTMNLLGILNKDKIPTLNQNLDMVYYHHGNTRSLAVYPVYENSDVLELRFRVHLLLKSCF